MPNLISHWKANFDNMGINHSTLQRVEDRLFKVRQHLAYKELSKHTLVRIKEYKDFELYDMYDELNYKNARRDIFYLMKLRRYILNQMRVDE